MTYCIWIGLSIVGFAKLLANVKMSNAIKGAALTAVVLSAPILMGTQNYDDQSRADHYGARDYASNFLNSLEKNAIIFTYGDNDTYPLWYAQEIEGIRTDVRVVNLSLIQVDWYIDQLRRKVNDSEALKFQVPQKQIRGKKRGQLIFNQALGRTNLKDAVRFMGEDHPVKTTGGHTLESFMPTQQFYINVDSAAVIRNNVVDPRQRGNIVKRMDFDIKRRSILKGDLAMLDILQSNFPERPIYFAVTVRNENFLGLDNYLQLEGLALRLVPVKNTGSQRYGALGALGKGYVYADKTYENITEKWRWGNFDKKEMFVDDKYGPSIQSMQYVFLRTGETLLEQNKKDLAAKLMDQYFEAFPHFNFPYDYSTADMIRVYVDAGAWDKAKPHVEILMDEMEDKLRFIESLDDSDLSEGSSFQAEEAFAARAIQRLLTIAQRAKDDQLLSEIKTRFGSFRSVNIQSRGGNSDS